MNCLQHSSPSRREYRTPVPMHTSALHQFTHSTTVTYARDVHLDIVLVTIVVFEQD